MSQSPSEAAVASAPPGARIGSDYRNGWDAVNLLIRQGGSLSSRETNNFYINCGDGNFCRRLGHHGTGLPRRRASLRRRRSRPGRRPGSHSEESKFAAAQAVAESGREWLQRGQFRPQGHAQQPGRGGSENHHRDRCGFQVEICQDRIGFPVSELPPGLVRPREPTGDPAGQDRMAQRGSPDLSGIFR